MTNDVRARIVMPILIPVLILLSMAAFIGSIVALLLFNTKSGATMLAAVAAAGILFTASLAAGHDRLDTPRRAVVAFAAALPLLAGAAVGFGLIGGVDDADRMINVEPLLVMPDGAPVIVAENSQEFCLGDDGSCEPIDRWEVTLPPESEALAFVFDNRQVGIQHNVQILDLAGSVEAPEPGSEAYTTSTLITGPAQDPWVDPEGLAWTELPENWYFQCVVHPVMNGVGTIVSE